MKATKSIWDNLFKDLNNKLINIWNLFFEIKKTDDIIYNHDVFDYLRTIKLEKEDTHLEIEMNPVDIGDYLVTFHFNKLRLMKEVFNFKNKEFFTKFDFYLKNKRLNFHDLKKYDDELIMFIDSLKESKNMYETELNKNTAKIISMLELNKFFFKNDNEFLRNKKNNNFVQKIIKNRFDLLVFEKQNSLLFQEKEKKFFSKIELVIKDDVFLVNQKAIVEFIFQERMRFIEREDIKLTLINEIVSENQNNLEINTIWNCDNKLNQEMTWKMMLKINWFDKFIIFYNENIKEKIDNLKSNNNFFETLTYGELDYSNKQNYYQTWLVEVNSLLTNLRKNSENLILKNLTNFEAFHKLIPIFPIRELNPENNMDVNFSSKIKPNSKVIANFARPNFFTDKDILEKDWKQIDDLKLYSLNKDDGFKILIRETLLKASLCQSKFNNKFALYSDDYNNFHDWDFLEKWFEKECLEKLKTDILLIDWMWNQRFQNWFERRIKLLNSELALEIDEKAILDIVLEKSTITILDYYFKEYENLFKSKDLKQFWFKTNSNSEEFMEIFSLIDKKSENLSKFKNLVFNDLDEKNKINLIFQEQENINKLNKNEIILNICDWKVGNKNLVIFNSKKTDILIEEWKKHAFDKNSGFFAESRDILNNFDKNSQRFSNFILKIKDEDWQSLSTDDKRNLIGMLNDFLRDIEILEKKQDDFLKKRSNFIMNYENCYNKQSFFLNKMNEKIDDYIIKANQVYIYFLIKNDILKFLTVLRNNDEQNILRYGANFYQQLEFLAKNIEERLNVVIESYDQVVEEVVEEQKIAPNDLYSKFIKDIKIKKIFWNQTFLSEDVCIISDSSPTLTLSLDEVYDISCLDSNCNNFFQNDLNFFLQDKNDSFNNFNDLKHIKSERLISENNNIQSNSTFNTTNILLNTIIIGGVIFTFGGLFYVIKRFKNQFWKKDTADFVQNEMQEMINNQENNKDLVVNYEHTQYDSLVEDYQNQIANNNSIVI